MTHSFLDKIKQRLAAATPGPWEWYVFPKSHMLIHRFSERGYFTVLETEGDVEADYPCANEADRALIEHAPADLAALIEEVEYLRGERAAVVAWLHSQVSQRVGADDLAYDHAASAIAAGKHRAGGAE